MLGGWNAMRKLARPHWLAGAVLCGLLADGAAAAPRKAASVPAPPAPSTPAPVRLGDARLGAEKASNEGKFPKLDGQAPDYILKQIRDFRSGARTHDFMQIMARSVSDEDVIDIAAYFHSLPVMTGDGFSQPGQAPTGDAVLGQRIFTQGDAARGVPACITCHGEAGRSQRLGEGAAPVRVPHIGGQEWRYLDKQLRDWRSGERRNSAGGVMNQAIQKLSDTEIESLANYLSSFSTSVSTP